MCLSILFIFFRFMFKLFSGSLKRHPNAASCLDSVFLVGYFFCFVIFVLLFLFVEVLAFSLVLNLKICMHVTFCIFINFDQISTSKCPKSFSCMLELMQLTANRWPATNFYSVHLKPNVYCRECHCSSKNSNIWVHEKSWHFLRLLSFSWQAYWCSI